MDYLEKARNLGGTLIVGLNTDRSVREIKGPTRPIVPQEQRARVVAALACVDCVTLFDEPDPLKVIMSVGPDVLVKGRGLAFGKNSGRGSGHGRGRQGGTHRVHHRSFDLIHH